MIKQTCIRIFHNIKHYDDAENIVKTYKEIEELFHVKSWELHDDNSISIEYDDKMHEAGFDSGMFSIDDTWDIEFLKENEITWLFYYDMIKEKLTVNRVHFVWIK